MTRLRFTLIAFCLLLVTFALAQNTSSGDKNKPKTAKPSPAKAISSPASQDDIIQRRVEVEKRIEDADARATEWRNLQDEKNELVKDKIETLQKEINDTKDLNLWATMLTLAVAIISILVAGFGVLFPVMRTREIRQETRERLEESKQHLEEITKRVANIQELDSEAEMRLGRIRKQNEELDRIQDKSSKGEPVSEEDSKTLKEVKDDTEANIAQRIKAMALEAQHEERWEEAAHLWRSHLYQYPDDSDDWFSYGYVCAMLFEQDGEDRDHWFRATTKAFEECTKRTPDMEGAWYNWGTALFHQAKTKSGKESDTLYEESFTKFRQAIKRKPHRSDAWVNWGAGLANQARTKSSGESDQLYEESYLKFAEAVKHDSADHNTWNNWGTALASQAGVKTGEESDRLFEEAYAKYHEAVKLDSDDHDVWNNWGTALLAQAKKKSGDDSDLLYAEAEEKYLRAETIEIGGGAYNLACVSALTNRPEEAKKWLRIWRKYRDTPSCEKFRADQDLDSLRELPWFRELMADHCSENQ